MAVETKLSRFRLARWQMIAAAASLYVPHALAAPLSEDACRAAKDEITRLEVAGVKADHERGPEWARANLDQARLDQVKRWIELQEAALFQCPRPKPAPKPSEAAAAGQPKAKPKADSAKPDGDAAQVTGSTESGGEKPKKPKKVVTKKTKPPVEDAYVPPAPSSVPEFQHTAPGNLGDVIPGAGLVP